MIILLDLLAIFDFAVLIVMLVTVLINAIRLPRLRVPPPSTAPLIHPSADTPLVSILITAHNEANTVAALVRSLLAQRYAPFEVILLDEQSTDSTGAIALAAAAGDARLRVITGQPLLQGWRAQNWARHQLAHEANGRVLIFADSDLNWTPDALKALVAHMQRSQADLLSIWTTPIIVTRRERLVSALLTMAVAGLMPAPLIQSTAYPALATANRRLLVFRKSAYGTVSGHVAVRAEVGEGMAFARLIKAKGLALREADGAGLITCRVDRGDLVALYGKRGLLAGAAVVHLLVFVLPYLWLLIGWNSGGWPVIPLILIALGLLVSAFALIVMRRRVRDAVWMPIAALGLAWTALFEGRIRT